MTTRSALADDLAKHYPLERFGKCECGEPIVKWEGGGWNYGEFEAAWAKHVAQALATPAPEPSLTDAEKGIVARATTFIGDGDVRTKSIGDLIGIVWRLNQLQAAPREGVGERRIDRATLRTILSHLVSDIYAACEREEGFAPGASDWSVNLSGPIEQAHADIILALKAPEAPQQETPA